MGRRFVNELADGETIDLIFLASEKQLRPNRAGNLYLQLRISDRTGSLNAMMWNADQRVYDSFQNGEYVRVQGTAQLYNGNLQVIVKSVQTVPTTAVDPVDFETISSQKIDELMRRLNQHLRSVQNESLRTMAECCLVDDALMSRMRRAPAGIKNHHAYYGGLLEHVVSLLDLVVAVTPLYAELDRDLMILGVFWHDLGKIEELTYEPDLGYSDSGQLLGHIVQGILLLEGKIRDTERLSGNAFPSDLKNHLQHIIVSHHGEYEFGSPKLPMTSEAIAIHYLDNLDAKLANFRQLIAEDANTGSPWTTFQPSLGRKIFKQHRK